jgi:hypothetical protein
MNSSGKPRLGHAGRPGRGRGLTRRASAAGARPGTQAQPEAQAVLADRMSRFDK